MPAIPTPAPKSPRARNGSTPARHCSPRTKAITHETRRTRAERRQLPWVKSRSPMCSKGRRASAPSRICSGARSQLAVYHFHAGAGVR